MNQPPPSPSHPSPHCESVKEREGQETEVIYLLNDTLRRGRRRQLDAVRRRVRSDRSRRTSNVTVVVHRDCGLGAFSLKRFELGFVDVALDATILGTNVLGGVPLKVHSLADEPIISDAFCHLLIREASADKNSLDSELDFQTGQEAGYRLRQRDC